VLGPGPSSCPGLSAQIADGALRSEEAVAGAVKAFADAGVTELSFDPTVSSLDQVDRLADVVR